MSVCFRNLTLGRAHQRFVFALNYSYPLRYCRLWILNTTQTHSAYFCHSRDIFSFISSPSSPRRQPLPDLRYTTTGVCCLLYFSFFVNYYFINPRRRTTKKNPTGRNHRSFSPNVIAMSRPNLDQRLLIFLKLFVPGEIMLFKVWNAYVLFIKLFSVLFFLFTH